MTLSWTKPQTRGAWAVVVLGVTGVLSCWLVLRRTFARTGLAVLGLGFVCLFVIVREWIQPTPARHRAPTQRVITLNGPAKRAQGTEDTGPLAQALASFRRP